MFESVDSVVHEGRYISVLGRVETFKEGFSGVDGEGSDGSCSLIGNDFDELVGKLIGIKVIDSQSAFYCAGYFDCFLHGFHTLFD